MPALENIFYGANISNILSAHKNTFLDIMAWLPYGIIHFGAPAVWSIVMFIFASPGTVPVFARSFGYMNIIGVLIQLLFPCSPPWYENMYGLAPANYSMKGSPAGLARIDNLFGIALYTPGFTGSPMVFGAFPSLHAGSAVMEALFMSHVFPRLRPVFAVYVLWMWWATMYLSHHYAVDLVGGSLRKYLLAFSYAFLANPRQLLESFSTLPKPNSYQEHSQARCYDGITITKRWAKTRQSRVMHWQTSPTARTTPMTGRLDHLHQFLRDRLARSTKVSRFGKEKLWPPIQTPESNDDPLFNQYCPPPYPAPLIPILHLQS